MKKILLHMPTEYQIKQCELFAKYSIDTNIEYYQKRMQFDESKVKKDIFKGKVAEFMVYNYLKQKHKYPTLPDLQIYSEDEKTFDCDCLKCCLLPGFELNTQKEEFQIVIWLLCSYLCACFFFTF